MRACVVAALLVAVHAAVPADEVTALPGWDHPMPSKQYSGYLNIDKTTGKSLHYWFVEAETSAADAPVFLWLNGGPGCSSLDGYMYEQGPFHVNETDHTKLYYNEYTWAKEVNILFLEAPAGVGFSYSPDSRQYRTNDTQTANDNFAALVKFFSEFSEYAANDFFISGESYAGVYVPTLAARILDGNAKKESTINLKGIMVGNGCTGNDVGICGGKGTKYEKDFLAGHSLVNPALSAELDQACGDYLKPSVQCELLLAKMSDEIGNVNIYDIYTPCINGDGLRGRAPGGRIVGGPDGCIDGIAAGAWLNSQVVTDALHVSAAKKYWEHWTICSDKIEYDSTASDLPKTVYPKLVDNIRVLIYNGDVDACVPWLDNDAWTRGMGYGVKSDWHPWSLDNQVAGYATVYDVKTQFDFVTIKGSGHMVPQYRPAPALEMLRRFVANQPF